MRKRFIDLFQVGSRAVIWSELQNIYPGRGDGECDGGVDGCGRGGGRGRGEGVVDECDGGWN